MADLNKIVAFHAITENSIADCTAINACIGPQFDIIANVNAAQRMHPRPALLLNRGGLIAQGCTGSLNA